MGKFGKKIKKIRWDKSHQKTAEEKEAEKKIEWQSQKMAIYLANSVKAENRLVKETKKFNGFIVRRLLISTVYVLAKTFGFRKSKFDMLNIGIDYMSDVVLVTKDFSAWDVQQGLLEECKYTYKKRKEINIDINEYLEHGTEEEINKIISFENLFNAYGTNLAIKVNEAWESVIMWSLRLWLGFGAKRLGRYQDAVSKLWSKSDAYYNVMEAEMLKLLKVDKLQLGTKPVHLPILIRDDNAKYEEREVMVA